MQPKITVTTRVEAPVAKVWDCWTKPEHITKWVFASDDWEAPYAENDFKVGGKFLTRMSAKDSSAGFDFCGVYSDVIEHTKISYAMEDGRKVDIVFTDEGDTTLVTETFDPETENPLEMQREGWQAILENFRKYVESQK